MLRLLLWTAEDKQCLGIEFVMRGLSYLITKCNILVNFCAYLYRYSSIFLSLPFFRSIQRFCYFFLFFIFLFVCLLFRSARLWMPLHLKFQFDDWPRLPAEGEFFIPLWCQYDFCHFTFNEHHLLNHKNNIVKKICVWNLLQTQLQNQTQIGLNSHISNGNNGNGIMEFSLLCGNL